MREEFLLNLDVGPSGAVLRAAAGAALVYLVRSFAPEAGLWTATAWLGVVLFGIKVLAAVARRVVPATPAVRAQWEWRRNLARFHDSYQWRKLLWFGAGILAAAVSSGPEKGWEVRLGVVCILSGAVADLLWRRKGLALLPPVRS
jgi:hypothetical protein